MTKRNGTLDRHVAAAIAAEPVTLSVKDRLLLLSLLPERGDLTTVRIVRELRERLSFGEQEHAALELTADAAGHITWNQSAAQERDFLLGEVARRIVGEGLTKLDAEKAVTVDHVGLFEKFGVEPAEG
jgi:hypothetical protein